MAEYFIARNLPVPPELSQNPLTRWRRLLVIASALAVALQLQLTHFTPQPIDPSLIPPITD